MAAVQRPPARAHDEPREERHREDERGPARRDERRVTAGEPDRDQQGADRHRRQLRPDRRDGRRSARGERGREVLHRTGDRGGDRAGDREVERQPDPDPRRGGQRERQRRDGQPGPRGELRDPHDGSRPHTVIVADGRPRPGVTGPHGRARRAGVSSPRRG